MKLCFAALITLASCSATLPITNNEIGKPPGREKAPAQVLNLTGWKLTLPVDTEHKGSPDEIKQPELNAFQDANWFFTRGKAVAFRANAGGFTTKGSNFPRSELREMEADGKKEASWSSSQGKHTLFIDQKVTRLPDVRKHIVIGQIHDADKYLIFFRLEDKKLLISVNKGIREVLDDNYKLGKRFTVKFVVENNETNCYYNDALKYNWKGSFTGAYFKAGAYVQSSCKGTKKTEGESCDAYGQVEIYNVWVKHED